MKQNERGKREVERRKKRKKNKRGRERLTTVDPKPVGKEGEAGHKGSGHGKKKASEGR